jgi:hypothetical protein
MMQLALCNCQDVTVHAYYGSVREQRRWYPPERTRIEQRHRALRALYQRHEANPEYSVPENTLAPDRLVVPADGLHRNGSGDFFLMHRDRWHELRGFTELPTRGHSDSLMCWTAASAGLRQQVLCPPARLFHQLHDREAVSGWPVTDWRQWYQRYVECRTTGTALITNTEDWGMRGETLPETVYPAATPSGDRDRR